MTHAKCNDKKNTKYYKLCDYAYAKGTKLFDYSLKIWSLLLYNKVN